MNSSFVVAVIAPVVCEFHIRRRECRARTVGPVPLLRFRARRGLCPQNRPEIAVQARCRSPLGQPCAFAVALHVEPPAEIEQPRVGVPALSSGLAT